MTFNLHNTTKHFPIYNVCTFHL